MAGLIKKIKNFFSGKFVCKLKGKPAQPASEQEPQSKQEEPKVEEKPEEQKQ